MNLDNTPYHKMVFIKEIRVHNKDVLNRLLVLGFVPHTKVIKVLSSPLTDPVMIKIRGNYIALSKNILRDIVVC